MTRRKDKGVCEHCHKTFGYHLIHNGFNDSSYAYCEKCGMTALLDLRQVPEGIRVEPYKVVTKDIESHLLPCLCGGSFQVGASPRCPHCLEPLSPVLAVEYIEAQAEGTKKGWRWQQSWTDLYCIIIEDRLVKDVWRKR